MAEDKPRAKPQIFVQYPGEWLEVEVRGWHGERMFIKCHHTGATIELNLKELDEKGWTTYTGVHGGSGSHYFTLEEKERETERVAQIIANPTDKEHYLWSHGQTWNEKTKRWSKKEIWQKHRILGWTATWIFLKVGWKAGDCEGIGNIAWVDRGDIKSKGEDWAAHGIFYTFDAMNKKVKDDTDRWAKEQIRKEEAEKARRKAERDRMYNWGQSSSSWGFTSTIVQNANDAKLLKVSMTASKAEIMASFKNLAKIHHPDMGGNLATFQNISAAKDRMVRRFEKVGF